MAIVELVFMLERDFEVTVPLQQAKTLHSVAGLMEVLQTAGKL
jgi:acyl carrier protein